jgi:FkbM family methyltransferase
MTNPIVLRGDFVHSRIGKPAYIDAMHEVHQCLYDYADFIRHTDISKIEITDGLVVMTTREAGVRLICDRRDKRIAPIEILNFGLYEAGEAHLLKSLIGPGDTVLDVGANVGFYTIGLAKTVPMVRIVAFEPLPQTFEYLSKNLELNGITNAEINNFGLSDEDDEKVFFFSPQYSVNASAACLADRADNEKIVCRVRRLDDFVASRDIIVDFIKCDVEGAELSVFRGGVETLRRDKPIIMTEMLRKWSACFGYHPNDIIELLAGLGYQCFVSDSERLRRFLAMDESTVETNFFFLHPVKHSDKIRSLLATCAA